MADNFRNKQWFKHMPQDRKDEICKKFDIDEKTLKKAGRETDDGRFVIDILRIDHLLHYPEEWDTDNNAIKNHAVNYKNKLQAIKGVKESVNALEDLYNLFEENAYSKYKESLHNNLLVEQTHKYVENDLNEYVNADEEDKPYYAYRLKMHLKVLLKSDLDLIKS